GGQLAIFQNDRKGGFEAINDARFGNAAQDQTGIVLFRDGEKGSRMLIGSANYEDQSSIPSVLHEYGLGKSVREYSLTNQDASIGPLALTDMDGDGELDLFVGGQVISGRYPEAASSRIYRHR